MKKMLKKLTKKKTLVIGTLALLFIAVVGFFFVYLKYGFIGADVSPIKANLTLSGGGQKTLGSNFDVMVNLNPNGNRVCVVDLSLTYPASILTLNAAPTLMAPFSLATIADSGTAGQIHYQIGATGCTTSSGGILKLNFKAQKTGQGTLSFTQTSILGGNDGQLEILSDTSTANVSVTSAGSSPTPTSTPTPTPTSTDTSIPPPTEEPTPTGEQTPTEGQTPAPPAQTTNLPQSSPGRSPAPTLSSRTGLPAPQQQTSAQPTTTKKSKYITWLLVILGLALVFEVAFILIKRRKEKV